MTILITILLLAAAGLVVLSIYLTIKMFSVFGSDMPAEERSAAIIKIRNKMIGCYVGAVVFITAAAMIKMFLM